MMATAKPKTAQPPAIQNLRGEALKLHALAKEAKEYYELLADMPGRRDPAGAAIVARLARLTGLPMDTLEQADSFRKKAWQAANTPDPLEVEAFRPATRDLPAHAAPPSGQDAVGVFTLLKGAQKAYKKILVAPDGQVLRKEDYAPLLTFWTAVSVGFATLEDVRDWYMQALAWGGYLTRTPMLAGYAPQAQSVRRSYQPSGAALGPLDHAAFAPEGSLLMIFDIDNLTVPAGTNVRDVALMVELIRLYLPPEAADADLMIAPSAGHGRMKDGEINVRFHVFAILDRPVDNDEGRRWFEHHGCKYLDQAMLSRTQPCYILREVHLEDGTPTADPFKHMEGYISRGSHAVVRVPELEKAAPRVREVKPIYSGEDIAKVLEIWPHLTGRELIDTCEAVYGVRKPRQGRGAAESEKRAVGRPKAATEAPKLTGGLKDALLAVGDHEGGAGFHGPLKRAAAQMWADRRFPVNDEREEQIIDLLETIIWNADAAANRSVTDDQEAYVRRKMPQVVRAIRLSEDSTRKAEQRRLEAQRRAMAGIPSTSLEETAAQVRAALDAALDLPLDLPRGGVTEEVRAGWWFQMERLLRPVEDAGLSRHERRAKEHENRMKAHDLAHKLRGSYLHHLCGFSAFEEHEDGTLELLFEPTTPFPKPGHRPLSDARAIFEGIDERIPARFRRALALQECGALAEDGFGLAVKVTPGAGKTQNAAEALAELFERKPDAAVLWLTPDHGLAEETAGLIKGKVYRGRPTEDEGSSAPEGWCVNAQELGDYQRLGGDLDSFCHSFCARRGECGYMRQGDTLKDPRVMVRAEGLAALTRGQPQILADQAAWPTPDVIVADDCSVQRLKQAAKFPVATLLKDELISFQTAYDLAAGALDLHAKERLFDGKRLVEDWLKKVSAEFTVADTKAGARVRVGQVRKLVPRFSAETVRALRIRPPLLHKAGVLDKLLGRDAALSDGERKRWAGLARAVSAYNYHLRWIERLVMALRGLELEDAPDHRVLHGWAFDDIEVATEDGGRKVACLNFLYAGEVADAFAGIPVVSLDATAPEPLLKLLKPRMVVQEIATEETNVRRTLYLVNSAKDAWVERVAYMDEWARLQAKAFGCDLGDVGIITHLEAAEALRAMHGGAPPYPVMHFNATRGRNGMGGVRVLGVFGRTLPPSSEVHAIGLALSGEVTEDRGTSKAEVALRLRDGDTSDGFRYSVGGGDVLEAVQWEIVEGELIQADGRARGIRRGADNPVDIFHFCDVGAADLVWDNVVEATADFDHLTGWRAVIASALDAGVRPLGRSGPIWRAVLGVGAEPWKKRREHAAAYRPGTVGEWLDAVADEAKAAATADDGLEVVSLGAGGERLGRAVLSSPRARGWLARHGLEVLAVETGKGRAECLRERGKAAA